MVYDGRIGPACREVVGDGHRVILKKSYQDSLEEKNAMTVDPNSIDYARLAMTL